MSPSTSLDVRAINGPNRGRTTAWITTPLQLADGEATTDLAHFALLVDTSNGIAVRRSPEEWHPNVDLTNRTPQRSATAPAKRRAMTH